MFSGRLPVAQLDGRVYWERQLLEPEELPRVGKIRELVERTLADQQSEYHAVNTIDTFNREVRLRGNI